MMQEANYMPAAYSVFTFHLMCDKKISLMWFPKWFASSRDKENSFFAVPIENHIFLETIAYFSLAC